MELKRLIDDDEKNKNNRRNRKIYCNDKDKEYNMYYFNSKDLKNFNNNNEIENFNEYNDNYKNNNNPYYEKRKI